MADNVNINFIGVFRYLSRYATYYIIRGSFNVLLWLFNHEFTTAQRIFVIENGYLVFCAGALVGIVLFLKMRK